MNEDKAHWQRVAAQHRYEERLEYERRIEELEAEVARLTTALKREHDRGVDAGLYLKEADR